MTRSTPCSSTPARSTASSPCWRTVQAPPSPTRRACRPGQRRRERAETRLGRGRPQPATCCSTARMSPGQSARGDRSRRFRGLRARRRAAGTARRAAAHRRRHRRGAGRPRHRHRRHSRRRLKIYLDASARSALAAAGSTCAGAASISATRRSSRISAAATVRRRPGVAPLRRADDAIAIVTDGRDVDDIVREIVTLARRARSARSRRHEQLYTPTTTSAAGTVRGIWRSLLRWPLYGLMRLLGVRVEGLENIPPDGTACWSSPTTCTTSTHLLIEIAFPRPLHFMAKEELFRFRPLGWIIRRFGNFRLRAARATAGGAARHRHAAARDRAGDVPRGNAQQDDATGRHTRARG